MEYTNRPLMRYEDGEFLGLATSEQAEASDKALAGDGGVGAFETEVDGEIVTCYVPNEEN